MVEHTSENYSVSDSSAEKSSWSSHGKSDWDELSNSNVTTAGESLSCRIEGDFLAEIQDLRFSGGQSNYTITNLGDGQIRISDNRLGCPDGISIVQNIDDIQFADGPLDPIEAELPVGADGDENSATGALAGNTFQETLTINVKDILNQTVRGKDTITGGDDADIFTGGQSNEGFNEVAGRSWIHAVLLGDSPGSDTLGDFGNDWTEIISNSAIIPRDAQRGDQSNDDAGMTNLKTGGEFDFDGLKRTK